MDLHRSVLYIKQALSCLCADVSVYMTHHLLPAEGIPPAPVRLHLDQKEAGQT